ncbi:MAG: ATP-dependent Clp protease adaptor ClpS [Deltaproteobacteria bacterium]|nr:ATP-dependent Clp protease adaptor ClpS [Deltaproteobacteria bacterium]
MASKKPTPKGPDGGTQTLERQKTKKPRLWKVMMHNDDYTTQAFVVFVLQQFFRKEGPEAYHIMMQVHQAGLAIVGVYSKDVAETKVTLVMDYAREHGHPLQLTLEPEG